MRYRNNKNYYIPDLVNKETGRVNEYLFSNENTATLRLILEHTCGSLGQLLQQYPNALEPEAIFYLMDRNYKKIAEYHLNPEYCYQYFSNCHRSFQGVRIYPVDSLEDPYLFLMRMTTNIGSFYQRRVDFIYDADEESIIPNSVVEVERKNGIVIQSQVSSKVLRKKKYRVF